MSFTYGFWILLLLLLLLLSMSTSESVPVAVCPRLCPRLCLCGFAGSFNCYASTHFRYILTTLVLIRNTLLAFTTSCVSIFDISNDILFSSLSFCYLYMTKKTSDLPLNTKKHPYFQNESRGFFALWLTCYYISARIRWCLN